MGSTFYPGFDPLGALGLPDGTHSTIRPGVILPHGLLAALLWQAGRPRGWTCSGRYPFACLSLDIPGESRLSQSTPVAFPTGALRLGIEAGGPGAEPPENTQAAGPSATMGLDPASDRQEARLS